MKTSKKYIFVEATYSGIGNERFTAGNKAVEDVLQIAINCGYKPLYIQRIKNSNKIFQKAANFVLLVSGWTNILLKVKKGDVFLMQCPIWTNLWGREFVQKILNKKCYIVSIIHDVEALRQNHSPETIREAKLTYSQSKVMIVHNSKMMRWFINQGENEKKLVNLELFDYLTDAHNASKGEGIVIAGNLNEKKAPYVYQLPKVNAQFELYGPNYKEDNVPNCHYNGCVDADKLPMVLKGKWGLVWDGTSIKTCAGRMGEYLRYNNPHKMSLYIAAGLPIIIWSEAAQAEFVKKYQIGIAVDSLENIQDHLSKVSNEQYDVYNRNVMNLSFKVRQGFFFEQADKKAMERLEKL